MTESQFSDQVVATIGDQPREPDAACEGCGARGTAGRATRTGAVGEPVEEHRYCARCWPEWSNREPPSAEWLSQVADAIRAGAAEKEGPLPVKVRAFLAEFGGVRR